jgi:hypothetical protein
MNNYEFTNDKFESSLDDNAIEEEVAVLLEELLDNIEDLGWAIDENSREILRMFERALSARV